MTSRSPFDAVVAGRRVFGVTCLFETEAERDQWLRGAHLDEVPELDRRAPPEAPGEAGESSQRGRPSFERTIAAAARAIGPKLDELETLRDQAREVQRRIAAGGPAADVPKLRTVEIWLRERGRGKVRAKCRGKSARATLRAQRRTT